MLDVFKEVKRKNLLPVVPIFFYNNKPSVQWKEETYHINTLEKLEQQEEYFSYKNKKGENKKQKITGSALITGAKSGIIVLDLDRNHGNGIDGIKEYKKLVDSLDLSDEEKQNVFNTYTVKTPNGGLHLYFNYRKGLNNNSNAKLSIDIRTDGGIIILPGSIRKTKNGKHRTYEVYKDNEIKDIPEKLFNKLQEIFNRNENKPKNKEPKETKVGRPSKVDQIYSIKNEGERDVSLHKYLCRMINVIYDPKELFYVAEMYNNTFINPPLEKWEVEKTVNSALNFMSKPYLDKNRRIIIGALVKHILEEKPNYVKGNNLYIYNEDLGIYEYLDTQEQLQIYYQTVKDEGVEADIDCTKAEKFAKTIHQCSQRYISTEYEKRYICCKNGIIDSVNNELLPYDSKYKIDCRFNGNFNPDYENWLEAYNNSKFKKFLKDVLIDDDVVWTLQEMWGLMLCPNSEKIQQIFIYKGSGSNGKSSLFDIQEALFYDKSKSICGIGLQAFKDDKFILSMAEGKRVNIVRDDQLAEDVGGVFKSIVCGEAVTTQKKHKDHIRVKYNLTWFYGVNELPNTQDKTWGFYRRNCIIPFNVKFGTREEVAKGEADRVKIPGITENIINNEIDIVFMWAYWGLQRVIKNRWTITSNKASNNAIDEYRAETDSVYAFYREKLVREKGSKINAKDLYKSYLEWAENEDRSPVKAMKFGRQLEVLGHKKYKTMGKIVFPDVAFKRFEEVDNSKMPFVDNEVELPEVGSLWK